MPGEEQAIFVTIRVEHIFTAQRSEYNQFLASRLFSDGYQFGNKNTLTIGMSAENQWVNLFRCQS